MDRKDLQQLETLLQNLNVQLTAIMAQIDKLLSLENNNTVAEVNLRPTIEKLRTDGKTLEVTVNDLVDVFKRNFGVELSFELRMPVVSIVGWPEILLMFEQNNAIDSNFSLRDTLTIIQHSCTMLLHLGDELKGEYIHNANTITTSE
jgi:hypothetical protein